MFRDGSVLKRWAVENIALKSDRGKLIDDMFAPPGDSFSGARMRRRRGGEARNDDDKLVDFA